MTDGWLMMGDGHDGYLKRRYENDKDGVFMYMDDAVEHSCRVRRSHLFGLGS